MKWHALDVASRLAPRRAKELVKERLGVPSLDRSLMIARSNGFYPEVVVDVGAYEGEWTLLCKEIWPSALVLMIEPLEVKSEALGRIAAATEGVCYRRSLLGASAKEEVPFYECETASSVLAEAERVVAPSSSLSMTTLDHLLETAQFPPPQFLKIDVQGYELEVLRGAESSFSSVEMALIELNLLNVYRDAPLAHEVIAHMHGHGFQIYDICTLYRRPFDCALWQFDALFVRSDSPVAASARWD